MGEKVEVVERGVSEIEERKLSGIVGVQYRP